MPNDYHGNALSFDTQAAGYGHHAQINSVHPEYAHHAHPLIIGFEDMACACPFMDCVHLYNAVRDHGRLKCLGARGVHTSHLIVN